MKVLLDACVPRPLRKFLPDHTIHTAQEMGWGLGLYQSPSSPVRGLFSSEAQTTSASFRANTCRFANAGGA
jgi:hypothetical protein